MEFYTNLADSILDSEFSSHNLISYRVGNREIDDLDEEDSDNESLTANKGYIIRSVLWLIEDEDPDGLLIMTLPQVADNPTIITDQVMSKYVRLLMREGKIKISTYQGFNILTYAIDRLISALQRIGCSEELDSQNLAFISSILPILGSGTYTRPRTQAEKLRLLLGPMYYKRSSPDLYAKISNNLTSKNFAEVVRSVFNEYEHRDCDHVYGYLTALLKLSTIGNNDERNTFIDDCVLFVPDPNSFRNLLRNFNILLDAPSEAYIPNCSYLSEYKCFAVDNSLCKVLKGLCNNQELYSAILEMLLGSRFKDIQPAIKAAVYSVLLNLSDINSGRSAMYNRLEGQIDTYLADQNSEIQMLFAKSQNKSRGNRQHHRSPRSFLIQISRQMINYTYNVHNCLLVNPERRMLEGEYALVHSGDQVELKISRICNTVYELNADGKLIQSERTVVSNAE